VSQYNNSTYVTVGFAGIGIGLDSTTGANVTIYGNATQYGPSVIGLSVNFTSLPEFGQHYFQAVEWGTTSTTFGNSGTMQLSAQLRF
jgi:hypothetical protein